MLRLQTVGRFSKSGGLLRQRQQEYQSNAVCRSNAKSLRFSRNASTEPKCVRSISSSSSFFGRHKQNGHTTASTMPLDAITTTRSRTGLPGDRLPALRRMLESPPCTPEGKKLPLRILETHSGLTGIIAEHARGGVDGKSEFHGLWSSSLTASTVQGKPDIEVVDTTARLDLVKETLAVTTKPLIYDADTGGEPEIFKFTVRACEELGVSAAIIEDKVGLKQNSLFGTSRKHQLADIDEFCCKIRAGISARRHPDFMVIARMESLIAGQSMEEALSRAIKCTEAGASGIMIHSRNKSPKEVLEFIHQFRTYLGKSAAPIVVVPSSYNSVTESELGEAGASICIYANQMLRASYPAMLNVAQSILNHSRSLEAEENMMSIKQIISLIDNDSTVNLASASLSNSQHDLELQDIAKTEGVTQSSPLSAPPLKQPHFLSARKYDVCGMHAFVGGSDSTPTGVMASNVVGKRKINGLRTCRHGSHAGCSQGKEDAPVLGRQQIDPSGLLQFLRQDLGMHFFVGVPDSCISPFCAELDNFNKNEAVEKDGGPRHIIAANEGSAIAMATGYYLATGKVPLVYMQNSGLGNAANPLSSAAHPEVYGIPMVMLVGWRGSPGVKDEPQHLVAGRNTKDFLNALDVEVLVLPTDKDEDARDVMRKACEIAEKGRCPVAVLALPKTFSEKDGNYQQKLPSASSPMLIREAVIERILDTVGPEDAVVATTGFTSRELYEMREKRGSSHRSDFLCVGSMGHALSIAQGLALAQPTRNIWCLDGDGAALMHMGSLASAVSVGLSNLRHILINNGVHESVGGQRTVASQQLVAGKPFSFAPLAKTLGYNVIGTAFSSEGLVDGLPSMSGNSSDLPSFLEVMVSPGARSNLGRPKISTSDARDAFMDFLAHPMSKESITEEAVAGCSMDGDPLLLTPGPLTTSPSVKAAMLHDRGSRDAAFILLTRRIREQLVRVLDRGADKNENGITAVPLQGSGTFAVEAMLSQFVPRDGGKLAILCNGAYGRRMADICMRNERQYVLHQWPEDAALDPAKVAIALDKDETTHVAVVACETTTGVLNPVERIAEIVSLQGKKLLVDAMSSFGVIGIDSSMPFDAIAASSNKGLQGSPGMAFVLAREAALSETAGNANTLVLDLYDQWRTLERNGQWRFTPPTHCLLSLAQALDEFEAEGGTDGRRRRYERNRSVLLEGMQALGFETILPDDVQSPVIVTFRMPSDPHFNFDDFYDRLSQRGYVIYPGKVASTPSFRVGCIGHIFEQDMIGFIAAARVTMKEMKVATGSSFAMEEEGEEYDESDYEQFLARKFST